MKFCKDCGGVLNLFGNNSSELCSSCIQHAKPNLAALAPKPVATAATDILLDASISCENDKIIIHSKEGWQLWSGPLEKKTKMADILKSAKLIYKIRQRRKAKN